jgi:hypothetical protein
MKPAGTNHGSRQLGQAKKTFNGERFSERFDYCAHLPWGQGGWLEINGFSIAAWE